MKTKGPKKALCLLLAWLMPNGGGASVVFAASKSDSIPTDLRDAPAAVAFAAPPAAGARTSGARPAGASPASVRRMNADLYLAPKPESWSSWLAVNSYRPVCGRGQTPNCRWGDCGVGGKIRAAGVRVPLVCWVTSSYRTDPQDPKIVEYTALRSPFDLMLVNGKPTAVRVVGGKPESVPASFGASLSARDTRVLVAIQARYAVLEPPAPRPPAHRPPHPKPPVHQPPKPAPRPTPPAPPPTPATPGKSLGEQFTDQEKDIRDITLGESLAATTGSPLMDEYAKDDKAAQASEETSALLLKKWRGRIQETAKKYVATPEADAKPSPTADRLTSFERDYFNFHPQIKSTRAPQALTRLMLAADAEAKKGDPKPGDLLISGMRRLLRQDVRRYAETGQTPVPEALVEWARKYLTDEATLGSAIQPFQPAAPPASSSALDQALQQLFSDPVEQALVGFLLQSAPNRADLEKALVDAAAQPVNDPARATVVSQWRSRTKTKLDDLFYRKADLNNARWLEAADPELSKWLTDRGVTQEQLLAYYCTTLWAPGNAQASSAAARALPGSMPQNDSSGSAPQSSGTAPSGPGGASSPQSTDQQQQIAMAAAQSIQAVNASNNAAMQSAQDKILDMQDHINATLTAGGSSAEGQHEAFSTLFDGGGSHAIDDRCVVVRSPSANPPGGPVQTAPPVVGSVGISTPPATSPDVAPPPPPKPPDHSNMYRNIGGAVVGAIGYALFGFAAFGPIGAVIGAIIGAVLGAVEVQLNNNPIGG